ncbi:MAG: two component regulator three y domain-containing protein [Reichenbachiella sp.]
MGKVITSSVLIYTLLSSILPLSLAGQYFKGIPLISTFLPKEYHAGMLNSDMAQDDRGVVYFANNYGLLEYDGNNWSIHSVSNGTKIRSLGYHPSGRVFIGAQNQLGYFFPDDLGTMQYHSLLDSLPKEFHDTGEVWNVFVSEDNVYFITIHEVFKFDGKKIYPILSNQDIVSSFLLKDQLYVQINDLGLLRVGNNHQVILLGSEIFSDMEVTGLMPLPNDGMLALTLNHGLFKFEKGNFHEWDSPINKLIKETQATCMIRLSNHEIAAGTKNHGIYIFSMEGELIKVLDQQRGFNNKSINKLMEDQYGNIWVGQNNGLVKIEYSSPFRFINNQFGIEGAGYCSYSDSENLYFGTNNGLYTIKHQNSNYTDSHQLKKEVGRQVYSIKGIDNDIIIGHELGAIVLNKNNNQPISDNVGAWKFERLMKRPDILIEGNYYGFQSYQYQEGEWKSLGQIEDFLESSRVFHEDTDGSFWMTHGYKGVYHITFSEDYRKIDTFKFYGTEDGFANNMLINVFKIDGELIFCSEQGIYSYDANQDRFILNEIFTEIFGPDIHIREMEEDTFGNIYFISSVNSGMLKKNKTSGYTIKTDIFNKIHRELNDDLENITALNHDNIMFGAYEGFIQYNPQLPTNLLNPIQTLIRRVSRTITKTTIHSGNFTDDNIIVANQPKNKIFELPFTDNSISFLYSATFADEDKQTQYSYYMEGHDKVWSAWTNKSEKEYTNLREADYVFNVKARNIYNIESEPTSYQFSIQPPWYRSQESYISYFLLFIGMIFTIVFSQKKVHTKEKRVLTLNQERELIKKDNQMVEYSVKSKAEIIRLETEKLELDINTKNKELASSTMNLINKNQLLTGLISDINQIIDHDKKSGNTKSLRDMIKRIDKNITHDQDWKHFGKYFDQVHGDFTKRLREKFDTLSPQEVKLSNYLRMSLSTKEIAQLMNITTRGVEIARYRLRKKLELTRDTNLLEYINRF